MPKPSSVTFNRYAAIAGRILRKSLKEEARVATASADNFELKVQTWKNGVPSQPKPLNLSLKKE